MLLITILSLVATHTKFKVLRIYVTPCGHTVERVQHFYFNEDITYLDVQCSAVWGSGIVKWLKRLVVTLMTQVRFPACMKPIPDVSRRDIAVNKLTHSHHTCSSVAIIYWYLNNCNTYPVYWLDKLSLPQPSAGVEVTVTSKANISL